MTDEIPAGDVVNTVASDAMRIGSTYDSFARFSGAIVAWIVVSFILLSTSVQLGLIVLLGVPILGSLTDPAHEAAAHAPRPPSARRPVAWRPSASDTVAGLRILRGVGGEEVFLRNYRDQSQLVRVAGTRIAAPQAGLESGQVLLPAILTGIVTFLGARDVMNGTLQPGQLVAFFGYSSFLTTPLRTAIDYVIMSTRAYVGAGQGPAHPRRRTHRHRRRRPRRLARTPHPTRGPPSALRLERGQLAGLVDRDP